MRDPELTHRAQVAAAGLERAWLIWRVVHGTAGDPRPTVSSYTGYSFEEPWGEPRVVFGIAAQDAEQLTALLTGYECVHIGDGQAASAAAVASNGHPDQRGEQSTPLPIPQQAASAVAEPSTADHAARPTSQTASEPQPQPDPAAASDETPSGPPGPGESADPPAAPAAPVAKKQAGSDQPAGGHKATAQRDRRPGGKQAAGRGVTEPGQRRRRVPDHAPAAKAPAEQQAHGEAESAPGPLASAASMARFEAEARIKAAMRSSDQAAMPDGSAEPAPPPSVPARAPARGGAGHRLAPPRSGWRESAMIARKAMRRPEAASGAAAGADASAPPPRDPGIGAPAAVVAAPATPAA